MKKSLFALAMLCFWASLGHAGEKKDSLVFEANDAIRYAQFLDFHKFGENWSAEIDTSGKIWIVRAEKTYISKKVIKDKSGQLMCDPEKGCTVQSTRTILMDKRNGKILGRNRYTRIRSN